MGDAPAQRAAASPRPVPARVTRQPLRPPTLSVPTHPHPTGNRTSDRTLQFQGFVASTDADIAGDSTAVEVPLPSLLPEGTDALWPIRVNILNSLTIAPEHNAQRHLRTQAGPVIAAYRAAQQAGGAREAVAAFERVKWSAPMTFTVGPAGAWSHELTTFARVGAIRSKDEAAALLKSAAAARKAAHDALEAHEAEKAARRGGKPEGGDDDDDEDDFELPPMVLGSASPAAEVRALDLLVRIFETALAHVRLGAKGDAFAEVPPASPVRAYRELQLRYFTAARDRAEALLGEARALAGVGGDGGAGAAPAPALA